MIPPEQNSEFVACMEDILSLYAQPFNPNLPVICMDEKPVQLLAEKRTPLKMRPGSEQKTDNEYVRNGICSIFIFTEPLSGWRRAEVSTRRTKRDWALQIQKLLEEDYSTHEKIILVMDNFNTHKISALYETFPPQQARSYAARLELHYTPKHGSWLNIAEIELSALSTQAMKNRIPSEERLQKIVQSWYTLRNSSQKGVDWHFQTKDARVKLKRLYPIIET